MRAITLLLVFAALSSCSKSDWEEMQFTDESPVNYVVKNSEDDGFVIREGLLVASSEKLLTVLDSGVSYPFELYLSGDGRVVRYVSRTNEWNNHRGILLVPDLSLLFSAHPELIEGFSCANEMALVIRDHHLSHKLLTFKVRTTGTDRIMRAEQWIN
jgi:hypothetical protein